MITLILGYFVALAISTLVAVALREKLTPASTQTSENKRPTSSLVLDRMDEIETLLNDTILELKKRSPDNVTLSSSQGEDRAAGISEELKTT